MFYMNIKNKLFSLGLFSILGMVSVLFTTSHFTKTGVQLHEATLITKDLEVRLLNLRRNEKDFLLRSDIKYLEKFENNYRQFQDLESELATVLEDLNLANTAQLRQDISDYHKSFTVLVGAYQVLGLSDDEGLLGQFHKDLAVNFERASDEEKLALYQFNELVEQGNLDLSLLSNAQANFLSSAQKVVDQKAKIGLKHNQGLLGEARSASHKVETQFKEFSSLLKDTTAEQLERLNLINNVLSGALLVIIVVLSWVIVRSIVGRIESLLSVIRRIVDSNDVSIRSELKGHDELGSLGEYFNQLLEQLEKLISESQKKSQQLTLSTSNMHNELETVIKQFDVQANHTGEMTVSVQEMVQTIGEISESTAIAAEGVQKARLNADKGREVVVETINNITQLSERLSSSQDSISSLNHHVDQIGDAVNIIQGIAEQTNLLALNAAIEAARAGEQGRGFAVVADEVRNLAGRTQDSTKEIQQMISNLQEGSRNAIHTMEVCAETSESTVTESMNASEALQQIVTALESITGMSQQIATAAAEQTQVSDDIAHRINLIEESGSQLNVVVTESQSSTQTLASLADELEGWVNKFSVKH